MDKKIFIPKKDIIIYFLISIIYISLICINYVFYFHGIKDIADVLKIYYTAYKNEAIPANTIILFFIPELSAIITNIILFFINTKKQILERIIVVFFNIFTFLYFLLGTLIVYVVIYLNTDAALYNKVIMENAL